MFEEFPLFHFYKLVICEKQKLISPSNLARKLFQPNCELLYIKRKNKKKEAPSAVPKKLLYLSLPTLHVGMNCTNFFSLNFFFPFFT